MIESSDKKIEELEELLLKTEDIRIERPLEREISDLKIKKIICNQRMIALQLKVKNELERGVISEVVSLVKGLISIGFAAATLAGAPWFILVPLMVCSTAGIAIKLGVSTYNYFTPPEKINEDEEVRFRTDHAVIHVKLDEKYLEKYLKNLFTNKLSENEKGENGLTSILAKKFHIYDNKKQINPDRLKALVSSPDGTVDPKNQHFKKIVAWANGELV
jgi:hypothetical protein